MNSSFERSGKAKGTIHVSDNKVPCGLEEAKEMVSQIKGVLDVESNHLTHLLSIEYDPQKVTLDQIRKAVDELCG